MGNKAIDVKRQILSSTLAGLVTLPLFLPHSLFASCSDENSKQRYWLNSNLSPVQCEGISQALFDKRANLSIFSNLAWKIKGLEADLTPQGCFNQVPSNLGTAEPSLSSFLTTMEEFLDEEAYKYLDPREIPEHYFSWFEELEKFKTIDEAYLHLRNDKTRKQEVESRVLSKLRQIKKLRNQALVKMATSLQNLAQKLPGRSADSKDKPSLVKLKNLIPSDDYHLLAVTAAEGVAYLGLGIADFALLPVAGGISSYAVDVVGSGVSVASELIKLNISTNKGRKALFGHHSAYPILPNLLHSWLTEQQIRQLWLQLRGPRFLRGVQWSLEEQHFWLSVE